MNPSRTLLQRGRTRIVSSSGSVQQQSLSQNQFLPSSATTTTTFWNRKLSTTTSKDDEATTTTTNNNSSSEKTKPAAANYTSRLKGPIVNQLWTKRELAKEAVRNTVIDMERPRPPSESITNISYPFSSDEFLKEQYRNPFGQMRFGKVLEDLDALAGNIAFAHVQDPDLTIVTASVDRIRLSAPPNLDADQHLSGKVTFVGTSSMEIRMQCKNIEHGEDPWMEGESCR